jgi:LynF/TruF/PatF family peptide O-prenyltransferase
MIVAEIQKNSLKEQRIQFIRNHQQAFDVEPIYPLGCLKILLWKLKAIVILKPPVR